MTKYKIIIGEKTFTKTRTRELAERTLQMAHQYGLTGRIEKIEEEDKEPTEKI